MVGRRDRGPAWPLLKTSALGRLVCRKDVGSVAMGPEGRAIAS